MHIISWISFNRKRLSLKLTTILGHNFHTFLFAMWLFGIHLQLITFYYWWWDNLKKQYSDTFRVTSHSNYNKTVYKLLWQVLRKCWTILLPGIIIFYPFFVFELCGRGTFILHNLLPCVSCSNKAIFIKWLKQGTKSGWLFSSSPIHPTHLFNKWILY